jgi:hypothetical protein
MCFQEVLFLAPRNQKTLTHLFILGCITCLHYSEMDFIYGIVLWGVSLHCTHTSSWGLLMVLGWLHFMGKLDTMGLLGAGNTVASEGNTSLGAHTTIQRSPNHWIIYSLGVITMMLMFTVFQRHHLANT